MADYDAADLLARAKFVRRRPSTDAGTSDPEWYSLLTLAEAKYKPLVAAPYPASMYAAAGVVALTSTDNKVWTIPDVNSYALGLQVLRSETGEPLKAGAYWDQGSDYVMEGATIRITRGRELSTVPYARVIAGPAAIDASTDSTILPEQLRILLVYHACALDAGRGGMDDPSFYETMEREAAWGDPAEPADLGLLGALKVQNRLIGAAGYAGPIRWWQPNS